MATSGHCVLDARLSSVTACWLMAIWMNVAHAVADVAHAVAAHWPHGHMVSVHGIGHHQHRLMVSMRHRGTMSSPVPT